jgi:hypothetical protein
MKSAAALCVALILSAIAAFAQTSANQGIAGMEGIGNPPQTHTIVAQIPQASILCPVGVRVQQAASWNAMEVDHIRPAGLAQLLHLTLANPNASRISKATVTVHGFTPKTRATLTPMAVDKAPYDAAKTLDVTFPESPGKEVSVDLWVPGLSAAYSIDLSAVTYADGSTWKLADGRSCRTSIDGFMLVGAR